MLFYKANIHWTLEEKAGTFCNAEDNSYPSALSKHWSKSNACIWNEKLYNAVSCQTTLCFMSEYEPDRRLATVFFGIENKEAAVPVITAIKQVLTGNAVDIDLQWEETTIFEIVKQFKTAERKHYLAEVNVPVWNLLDNHFRYDRNIITGTEARESVQKQSAYGCSEVLYQARNCFAGACFREEIERIYSDKNPKKFYGNPIHYDFCFTDTNAARKLIRLLSQALLENGRLLGRRTTTISFFKLDLQYDEDKWKELETLCKLANGTMLVIDFTDNDSNEKPRRHPLFLNSTTEKPEEEIFKQFFQLMEKYQQKTLFVLLENPQQRILQKYASSDNAGLFFLQFIEQINDRADALKFLAHFLEESNVKDFVPKNWENILTYQNSYTAEGVLNDYNDWYSHALQDFVYTAYHGCLQQNAKPKETENNYAKLQNMIGLKDIKRIIDTILADFQIRKIRQKAGLKNQEKSLHMMFTGNPGSAKTTCARLLAGILKERSLLPTGEFIECGRSDLVGKYVGWTAQIVKEKFQKASGGVLFIDEAYALNSNDNFGPEAINTIVQEMENHRDDVIVIFAGYPEPMEQFLQSNEGLRSRITFHLHFPDYNAEEMTEIFELMLKEQGYICDADFSEKAKSIFSEAVKHADFGNGRFVRNLLEQSIMKQSVRLSQFANHTDASSTTPHPLLRQDLIRLMADDLAVENVTNYQAEKPSIGFI